MAQKMTQIKRPEGVSGLAVKKDLEDFKDRLLAASNQKQGE